MVPGVLYKNLSKIMLNDNEKKILKQIASKSIEYGLLHHKPWIPDLTNLPEKLKEKRASFVTITKATLPEDRNLRGCIGSILAENPLAIDIAQNSFNAAFRDPRFSPLSLDEFPDINIKISILSPFEKINAKDLKDLLSKIRPNIDGIYLKSQNGQATFLPDVWEKVSNKELFIYELYRKAGLTIDYPFSQIEWYRYTTERF
jgi:AmmeMemoRadiSam system protein A